MPDSYILLYDSILQMMLYGSLELGIKLESKWPSSALESLTRHEPTAIISIKD